mgnify:FL=1
MGSINTKKIKCIICHENIDDSLYVQCLICNVVSHYNCTSQWIEQSTKTYGKCCHCGSVGTLSTTLNDNNYQCLN